jgi:hypothetical protein
MPWLPAPQRTTAATRLLAVGWDPLWLTSVHRFPGHSMWCIFPGINKDLNLAGRSEARCGTWKSPMHRTNMLPDCVDH